jgi:hypothetical protein
LTAAGSRMTRSRRTGRSHRHQRTRFTVFGSKPAPRPANRMSRRVP